jgi:SAM-dependent methyltransferase
MASATSRILPDYSSIAEFYQTHWCGHYHPGLIAMLQRLVINHLPRRARILDVCCGTGTVARHFAAQGFRITGIDASREMLHYAREQVPDAEFIVADARDFAFPSVFDAALCTFDSLSYMLSREELLSTFANVRAALRPAGVFAFDMSLEETYKREWQSTCSVIEEDEACFVRGSYDETDRLGRTLITRFHRNGAWERTDVAFVVRCHDLTEICAWLSQSGFARVACHRSDGDDRLRGEIGAGRACVVASK